MLYEVITGTGFGFCLFIDLDDEEVVSLIITVVKTAIHREISYNFV